MRPATYSADALVAFLREKTVATMPEIMAALGTQVERTVFRKLAALRYRASYSHGGRYYALDESARFDALGLWSFRSAWFSARGSLVDTAAAFVEGSNAGRFASELDDLLHVKTKDCLRHLAARGRLVREEVDGRHLYCSADPVLRQAQVAARQAARSPASGVPSELKATIILFLGMLDEKQRRVFAGLESLRLGAHGDALVAQTLGLDPTTVAKGRGELQLGKGLDGPIRRPGAGRKPVEKKRRTSSRRSRNS
jgi:hypothetical protein